MNRTSRLFVPLVFTSCLLAGFADRICTASPGPTKQATKPVSTKLSDAKLKELNQHIFAAEKAQVETDAKVTLRECDLGLLIDPKNRKLLTLAADANRDLGQLERAMKFANELVALDPTDIAAHRVRMRLYEFRNDKSVSKQELDDLMSMSRCPNITSSDYEMRAARLRRTYPALALIDLKTAKRFGSSVDDQEHTLFVEAMSLEKLGKHTEAIVVYTKLINGYPITSANNLRRRAKSYQQLRKFDLAKADLEEADRRDSKLYAGAPFRTKSNK